LPPAMLTLNNLQNLPHENHRKKTIFQTIVVQMNADFWVGWMRLSRWAFRS
jgi:hypothetical protein